MNNNKQQQAIILKGIAHQILNMNVPTMEELEKLLNQFDLISSAKKFVVLTASPQGLDSYIELPFVDKKSNGNYFIAKFNSLNEAILFADKQSSIFSNKCTYGVHKVVDANLFESFETKYGGILHAIYKCNGREWMVWKNPNFLN